jgi:hypothetical protein
VSRYLSIVDGLCDKRTAELKRDLFGDEVLTIQDQLLDDWIRAELFDDLIDHALEEFEVSDGQVFCAVLGKALCDKRDRARIERLFLGLVILRETAFWRVWPRAEEGQPGGVKEAAQRMTAALESLAELWHCYWVLGDQEGMESAKSEMLRVQSREKKPRRRKGVGTNET